MSAEPDPAPRAPGLAITCGATFMAFLDATIVNLAFPDIQESFEDSSVATLSWQPPRSRAPAPTPAT